MNNISKDKINVLRSMIKENNNGIEALLVTKAENIFYLSGFTGGTDANLLITDSEQFIITDFRYIEQVKTQCPQWKLAEKKRSFKEVIQKIASDCNISKLGFEDDGINFMDYSELKDCLPKTCLISQHDMIEKIRITKTDEEIQNIRQAAAIADKAFDHIVKLIKPGISENDLALELEFFMRKNGASGLSFETIIASGKRSSLPHGAASDKLIETGDFVTFDFGCIYNHYCSDMTRTVVVGEVDELQRKIYDIVLETNKKVLERLGPNASTFEIDKLARDIIASYGYGDKFGHGLGHGVGLLIHEAPSLNSRTDSALEPGMVVTDEPGIYIPDFGGVRIEDLVLITEKGIEVLSHSPKELIII